MNRCGNCRYWSEMCAQSIGGGPVEAVCLAPSGQFHGKYMRETKTCQSWKSNHHGAVDAPPNYGEHSRAAYEAEEQS